MDTKIKTDGKCVLKTNRNSGWGWAEKVLATEAIKRNVFIFSVFRDWMQNTIWITVRHRPIFHWLLGDPRRRQEEEPEGNFSAIKSVAGKNKWDVQK